MNKHTIRENVLYKRNQLSNADCKRLSSLLAAKLMQLEEYTKASELYTYVSFGTEANTYGLISSALLAGKKVCVPKILSKGIMEFYQICDLCNLIPGKFGIQEPDVNAPGVVMAPLNQAKHPLVVVPGAVFDTKGSRIGYGGGYYDRYLVKDGCRDAVKAALCYECQLVDQIETEEFDVSMDLIVTETKVYDCR